MENLKMLSVQQHINAFHPGLPIPKKFIKPYIFRLFWWAPDRKHLVWPFVKGYSPPDACDVVPEA